MLHSEEGRSNVFQPNGFPFMYRATASGKPVVLLHGCSPLSRCVTDAKLFLLCERREMRMKHDEIGGVSWLQRPAAFAPATLLRAAEGKRRVVVVGAGLAGLSCAYELRKLGFEAIVLEGQGMRRRQGPDAARGS